MGSRILEYIIRAKDATAAAIRAAKDRVISLSRESARAKVEIKGEDKTAQAVESAKRRVKEAAAEIQESVKATSGKIAQDGAGAFGKLENSAGKAATNILSQMAGIPGPVGNVLSQIGSMASASLSRSARERVPEKSWAALFTSAVRSRYLNSLFSVSVKSDLIHVFSASSRYFRSSARTAGV